MYMARILIIEDNDMLNQAYTFMLKTKGHTVDSAFDGEQGLKKAKAFKPEIILLDYVMPKMDGKEFLENYDLPKAHPSVKVLLLTNLSEQEKISEAMKLGVYKYFLKAQTEPSQLVGIIEEITTKPAKA